MPVPNRPDPFGLNILAERLDNPRPAMMGVGGILINASEKAFEEGRFGDFTWPEQYEGGKEPWIHIAGAASDLKSGSSVKETRFSKQSPPLHDDNVLARSIDYRYTGRMEVAVGTSVPYAKYHQWGSDLVGPAVTPVTTGMKVNLAKAWKEAEGDRKKALGKMWHWFRKDSIDTHIRQRPFLGITDEIESDIREAIEMFMEKGEIS